MLTVSILQHDIDQGLVKSYTHDAVCRAMRRAIMTAYQPSVKFQLLIADRDYCFINGHICLLPKEVGELIGKIDNQQRASPLTFQLDNIPEHVFL